MPTKLAGNLSREKSPKRAKKIFVTEGAKSVRQVPQGNEDFSERWLCVAMIGMHFADAIG